MKDLHISARQLRHELYWFLSCLGTAVLINTYAIVKFSCPWSELFTQLHLVLVLALVLWLLITVIRAMLGLLASLRR